ncbi:MAG TPA: hypothetical protein VH371_06690 [Candidatus Limnocylindrales bacterium]|jgi:hypothetical protein
MTDAKQTGVGTGRSADDPTLPSGGEPFGASTDSGVDPDIVVGATSGSHPAAAKGVDINRSGSGGTGGPGTDEPDSQTGSQP